MMSQTCGPRSPGAGKGGSESYGEGIVWLLSAVIVDSPGSNTFSTQTLILLGKHAFGARNARRGGVGRNADDDADLLIGNTLGSVEDERDCVFFGHGGQRETDMIALGNLRDAPVVAQQRGAILALRAFSRAIAARR